MANKIRYKMFKSGKLWCYAAILFGSLALGTATVNDQAKADTVDQPTTTLAQTRPVAAPATSTNLPVNNEVPRDTTTVNNDANANAANLDSYSISADQQAGTATLNSRGWQVVGRSNDQQYRYAILFDRTTNREIGRQRVTPIDRPDVQQAYNHVDNSLHSGFNVNFALPNNVAGHSLSIVARYSNDANNGEGQYTDYWFAPITIDNQNRANLDSIGTDSQSNVTVRGWHASNQALGKRYHYIIAFDSTTGREIARQRIGGGVTSRSDVSRAFPTIANAAFSGFSATFKLTPQYSRDNIQFISRWTNDPAGNGDMTDYWFAPVQKINRGNLDDWNISDGSVRVRGWHADDASLFQPYHFLILFDNTTGRQVAAQQVQNTAANDVARVFRDTYSANKSRFNADFANVQLLPNHSYSLVSRYSVINSGNGDDGIAADKTDYWYPSQPLNQRAYYIDGFTTNDNQLTVHGWMANDHSTTDSHPYLILLNNGREIGRNALTLTSRDDVARVYPKIFNSRHSGFSTTFTMPNNVNGNLTFVLRFSNDGVHGEGQYDDIYTGSYVTHAGHFDTISTNGDNLTVSGWHATQSALNKRYSYVFAMDGITGREIARWKVMSPISRSDVQKVYPWISDSDNSGFSIHVNNDALKCHEVRFMHRYTDDANGNGNFVDYYDTDMYYFNDDGQKAVNQFITLIDPSDNYPDGRPHTLYSVYFGDGGKKVYGAHFINGHWYNFQQGNGKLLGFSQRVIDWFRARRHHLTYSQRGSRNGADGTADCSGSMTQALRDAGASPYYALYSTESIHGYLRSNGYYLAGQGTGFLQVQYGDIIVWGRIGYSSGDFGHTVAISSFGNGENILCISTCGYGEDHPNEAVQEYNYYRYWRDDDSPYQYVYRPYNPARA